MRALIVCYDESELTAGVAMIPPLIPIDEARRLFALRRLKILDTEAEPAFDHVVRLAQQLFAVPIALISLIDKDRQWFKARIGVDVNETPRDISFCGHAILNECTLIVNNALNDERFRDNPLVLGAPHIRAYVGAPLHAPGGERIGTLCIIDTKPRQFTASELKPLQILAAIVDDFFCRSDDLLRTAYYDVLTSLPNRLQLHDKLDHMIAQRGVENARRDGESAQREGESQSAALIGINIDQFRKINQSLGHAVGDALLQHMACRIVECVAGRGIVGRGGSDEFFILLPRCEQVAAAALAATLLQHLSEPFLVGDSEINITVSSGISCYPQHGGDANELFACADLALSTAKEQGRNLCRLYEPETCVEPHRRFLFHSELRHALAVSEFEFYYQPQIDIESGDIVGLEALLRWNHPRLGLLTPADFIEIAEDSGLIVPIGAWMFDTACREAKMLLDAGLLTCPVALNVSELQFSRDGLAALIAATLAKTALPPGYLELELTEAALIGDPSIVLERIAELKALGVSLAIDDFGTGYSNVAYLRKFGFSKLKIDQSFTRRITQSAEQAEQVKILIQISRGLQLKALAEGVETQAQADLLHKLGCAYGQGHLFSHPMPAAALQHFLKGYRAPNVCSR